MSKALKLIVPFAALVLCSQCGSVDETAPLNQSAQVPIIEANSGQLSPSREATNQTLRSFVNMSKGHLELNITDDDAKKLGVSRDSIALFRENLIALNSNLDSGVIQISEKSGRAPLGHQPEAEAGCTGRSGSEVHIGWAKIYVNSCQADAATDVASFAALLCGFGWETCIVSAPVAAAGYAISITNKLGGYRGVQITVSPIPPLPIYPYVFVNLTPQ